MDAMTINMGDQDIPLERALEEEVLDQNVVGLVDG